MADAFVELGVFCQNDYFCFMGTSDRYLAAAKPSLDRIRAHFGDRPFVVSDVVDAQGHQYVNLVQEGGGVLGIALIGYTYVLEQMGIRFMKMAGTSAGAINTMMMACAGGKEEAKSTRVLEWIATKNLFDFVDGHPAVRPIIRRLVTSSGFFRRLRQLLLLAVVALLVALLVFAYQLGRSLHDGWYYFGMLFFMLVWGSAMALALRVGYLYTRFLRADFGINPGNAFLEWVTDILAANGIRNLVDLRKHIEKVPEGGFRLRRSEDQEVLSDLNKPRLENFLTLVASDVTNQMKVEFPRHWPLYWSDPSKVNPGYFVRASMAVPIFFEPFIIRDIPRKDVYPIWEAVVGLDDPYMVPTSAHFVDGGMISNFPINVFYNPNVAVPRLPTFGIMLEDTIAPPRSGYNSFMGYAAAMFNTVRFNYDKEFLIKNADFNRTIGRIDVAGINWLNFNISEDEKLDLFRRGAEAAARFLLGEDSRTAAVLEPAAAPTKPDMQKSSAREGEGFDWDDYKQYRKSRKHSLGY